MLQSGWQHIRVGQTHVHRQTTISVKGLSRVGHGHLWGFGTFVALLALLGSGHWSSMAQAEV